MDDIGLSLSLSSSRHVRNEYKRPPAWVDLFSSSGDSRRYDKVPLTWGIDVNRAPAAERLGNELLEGGGASPDSTLSNVSGKGGHGCSADHELLEGDRASSRGVAGTATSDEDDGGDVTVSSRKKLRLSKDQSAVLEESFKEHSTLNPAQKLGLAKQLNLMPRQVEVWFQNRRARTKLKQTEVECEYLRRSCQSLKEENRRLHKEVQELRALKLRPHLFMHMSPPTTLTMCPSCERLSPSSACTATSGNNNAVLRCTPVPLRQSL